MKEQSIHSDKVYKIDGVGVNLERFYPVKSEEEKAGLRMQKGFSAEDFILLYTAEFIPRKNHKLLFDILPDLKKNIPPLKMILCGKGELLEHYKNLAMRNSMDYITFTGYTKEVANYCRLSDVLVMPSFQEGLPVSIIEALATGLPVIASNIRGHIDAIEDYVNGVVCDLSDERSFAKAILLLYKNPELRKAMGVRNIRHAQKFSVDTAVQKMAELYTKVL